MTVRRLRTLLLAMVPGLLAATPATAQQLHSAVVPDTVAVGDVFHIALRIDLPPGYRAEFPDSIPLEENLESGGRVRRKTEPLEDGGERLTVAYPLTAWRPGAIAVPSVSVRLRGPDAGATLRADLTDVQVLSVLPADTAGVEPQPAKDVFGGDRVIWPLVASALGLLLIVGGLAYWLLTRPRPAPVPAPMLSPRERALQELQRAHDLGLIESGEMKGFYSLVSEAVRHYLEAMNPAWGADLTTSELLPRTFGAIPDREAVTLARTLEAADLVKFARHRPDGDEARATWLTAKRWVETYEWRDPAEEAVAQEAATEGEQTEAVAEPATVASAPSPSRTEVA